MIEELLRQDRELNRARINSETGKIPWLELQRFFANGSTLYLDSELDLVEVACAFLEDDVESVKAWTDQGRLAAVSDSQAKNWVAGDESLWAVVVKPWVLVQELAEKQ